MYEPKAKTTKISYTSRASIKLQTKTGDNFYTVEATEERSIPDVEGVDINEEWKALCSEVDGLIDYQTEQIVNTFKV